MAIVSIPQEEKQITDLSEMAEFLARYGIWYRKFEGSDALPEDAGDQDILAAYDVPIKKLMAEGGYVAADVINIQPATPNLDAMLAKFNKEHWHDEDEIRFIVHGSGLFHIHPKGAPVFRIEVFKGDMINVPAGTLHWFDLCTERRIRAIRLFLDRSGWTPRYTGSGEDSHFQPLCFGGAYLAPRPLEGR